MAGIQTGGTRVAILLLALSLAASAVAGVAAAPRAGSDAETVHAVRASQYCPDGEEAAFLKQINSYRAANGLPALKLSRKLGAAADHHSVDMATKNYFSHTFSNGTTWSQNVANHDYTYNTYTGENIAAGYETASKNFTAWKNSSGHRASMLNSNFKAIGIGRAYSASARYGWYWTTTFGGYADTGVTAC